MDASSAAYHGSIHHPESLPPAPQMRKKLRAAPALRAAIVGLVKNINEARTNPLLPARDVANVWKLWLFGFPRLLFCANARDSNRGDEAGVAV